jgi:raffinose/stachyose/melibiose transport system permease protein
MKDKLAFIPKSILQIFLAIWAVIQLFPIIWMYYSSFKPTSDIATNVWAFPKSFYIDNFIKAWSVGTRGYSIGLFFRNSIIVTAVTLILLAIIPTMAAYGVAKLRFPGRTAAIVIMISLISIPVHSIIIPLYYFLDKLNLINNYLGLILVYTAFNIPFSVLLMQSFFKEFPDEIIDAAKVDGCNEVRVFFNVVFPITKGSVATALIVSFINVWNEFLFALIIMKDNTMKTLPVGINIYRGQYGTEWGQLMASLVSASVISFIFYFIFQKQIVSGMSIGAVKE